MRPFAARALLACALLFGALQAPATAEETASAGTTMERALAHRGDAAASLLVASDQDGVHLQRQMPEAARSVRPQLILGDPRRLLEGPFTAGDEAPLMPATPALAALADRLGLPTTSADASAEPEVEGNSLEPGAANTETYRFGYPLADVNGDGTTDMAVFTYVASPDDSHEVLEVRDGRTGAVLWTDTSGAGDLEDLGDVDGDGGADLLARTITVRDSSEASSCDGEGCEESYSADVEFELAVVDGATGAVRWSQRTPGHVAYDYSWGSDETTEHEAYSESVTWLGAQASDDHDGDGQPDILVTRTDYTYNLSWDRSGDPTGQELLVDEASAEQLTATTNAAIQSGTDGSSILTLHENSLASLQPDLGDVTGDGVDDLRWSVLHTTAGERTCRTIVVLGESCEANEAATYKLGVELRDGVTATPLWSAAPVDNPGWDFAVDDLDGDGVDDVLVTGYVEDGASTTVISGASGATLWSVTDVDWVLPVNVADLDGDGDPDALAVIFGFDSESGDPELILRRLDGATGQGWLDTNPLASESGPSGATCGAFLLYVYGQGVDADADGVADPLAGSASEWYGGEQCEEVLSSTSAVAVESAASGTPLHQESYNGFVEVASITDLDGDGGEDVIRIDDGARTSWATIGLAGPELWALDGWAISLDTDLDGVPGSELAHYHQAANGQEGAYEEVFDVLSGLDTHLLWGVGGMNP